MKSKPFVLLWSGVVCVSTAGIIAHDGLVEATPLALAAWRIGIAAIVLLSAQLITSRKNKTSKVPMAWAERFRLIAAGIFLSLHFVLWFISLQYTTVSVSTLLVCTMPFWTALFGFIVLKHRPDGRYWSGLTVAFVGVLLVISKVGGTAHLSLLGDTLAVVAGMMISGYLLCVEGLQHHSTQSIVTWTYGTAAAALWIALIVTQGIKTRYSVDVWISIALLALIPQIMGHTLLNNALRHYHSRDIGLAVLAEPVITAILAVVLLHERLSIIQIAGGLIVLASIGFVLREKDLTPALEEL